MPQQAPAPQPDSIILAEFDGLKNTVSRERLSAKDLESAVNIDIDDAKQIHRRRGYTQLDTASYHSLFNATDGSIYVVKNDTLGLLRSDLSFVALQTPIGSMPWAGGTGLQYAQVGTNIYFTSPTTKGIIDATGPTVGPWGGTADYWYSPVVNPTSTLPPVAGKLLGPIPLGSTLAYYKGRLYIGSGNVVWATELYTYIWVDKTKGFLPFEGEITMTGAVGDGVYVGTTEGLWFLEGEFPQKRTRVMDSGVIPGSMVYIPAELANPPQVGTQPDTPLQVSIMFQTASGICVAQDSGQTYNLTEGKFFFPNAERSAAFFRQQDGMYQYIAVNDSEGQPANNARIGDYIDAEIVRFNDGWVDMPRECVKVEDQFTVEFIA